VSGNELKIKRIFSTYDRRGTVDTVGIMKSALMNGTWKILRVLQSS
jgi:hypothetical protein